MGPREHDRMVRVQIESLESRTLLSCTTVDSMQTASIKAMTEDADRGILFDAFNHSTKAADGKNLYHGVIRYAPAVVTDVSTGVTRPPGPGDWTQLATTSGLLPGVSSSQVEDMAVASDGALYAVGTYKDAGGVARWIALRYTVAPGPAGSGWGASGTVVDDFQLSPGGEATAYGVAVGARGDLIVAGSAVQRISKTTSVTRMVVRTLSGGGGTAFGTYTYNVTDRRGNPLSTVARDVAVAPAVYVDDAGTSYRQDVYVAGHGGGSWATRRGTLTATAGGASWNWGTADQWRADAAYESAAHGVAVQQTAGGYAVYTVGSATRASEYKSSVTAWTTRRRAYAANGDAAGAWATVDSHQSSGGAYARGVAVDRAGRVYVTGSYKNHSGEHALVRYVDTDRDATATAWAALDDWQRETNSFSYATNVFVSSAGHVYTTGVDYSRQTDPATGALLYWGVVRLIDTSRI